MTQYKPGNLTENLPLASGPTISASYDQFCGWCRDEIRAAEAITYTNESGWCHHACTVSDD